MTIVKPENFKKVKWPLPKRITLIIHEPIPFNEFRQMTTFDLSSKVKNIIDAPLKSNTK